MVVKGVEGVVPILPLNFLGRPNPPGIMTVCSVLCDLGGKMVMRGSFRSLRSELELG